MKKSLFLVLFLALMGGAMAQNEGVTEYVSALITFRDGSTVPQDSLSKYGVVIQTRSGRMATALIAADHYQAFLDANLESNPKKCKYFLPFVVNDQLADKTASVRVLPCEETWYGVTYREDLESVVSAIADMKKAGIYKEDLWA